MKKFRILTCSLLAGLVLTGCGTKTLTCTRTESNSGADMKQEIKVVFKGKKVADLSAKLETVAVEQVIKDNWNAVATALESQFPESDKDGIKISTENNEDKYSFKVTMDIDIDKATESALSEYNLDGITSSEVGIEKAKENYEKMGYTCK